jgi:hypothetical protein
LDFKILQIAARRIASQFDVTSPAAAQPDILRHPRVKVLVAFGVCNIFSIMQLSDGRSVGMFVPGSGLSYAIACNNTTAVFLSLGLRVAPRPSTK